jgi:hypothetical protein
LPTRPGFSSSGAHDRPKLLSYDIEDSSTRFADLRRGICIVNLRLS